MDAAFFGFDSSHMFLARKQVHVEPCSGMFPPVSSLSSVPDDLLEERKQHIRNMLESGSLSAYTQRYAA
jgi:hypothetical protein